MQPFIPNEIYLDPQVQNLPMTHKVLHYFKNVPVINMTDPNLIKNPSSITDAKKKLYITRYEGDVVKSCQGSGGDYLCCHYLIVSFISNCHMECSYCILQDYLKNNPTVTLFANVEEILSEIETFLKSRPTEIFRLGTGELSDSLALDSITGLSNYLIPFTAKQKNLILELKTKSNQIQNLLDLDHQRKTVISWSVNPQKFIDTEEWKTSSLDERLTAARKVANKGYKIGFHFDPIVAFQDWKNEYRGLIAQLSTQFKPQEIAWISFGSLRYTQGLKKIIEKRFPKSQLLLGELFLSKDGKIRYFREIREELYRTIKEMIDYTLPGVPYYLCMETNRVWKNVCQYVPCNGDELEKNIRKNFEIRKQCQK